jgi:hypothetical protein
MMVGPWKCTEVRKKEADLEEGMLKLDFDEEDTVKASHVMGIAMFYSWKSYNPQYLFADMINVWGIQKFARVEKIGDYIFKVEFVKEKEKLRVLEGGLWRHKGDALSVVHYEGLVRPSKI